jgi:hypothetical protein
MGWGLIAVFQAKQERAVRSSNQTSNQSVNPSANQSIKQAINRSINPSIKQVNSRMEQ